MVIYNTLTRQMERFEPLHAPNVGMYVCGPTVYGDPHLGHARPAITFDLLFRYLKHLGYKVRYVRNITDVGHLEHDADEGEDKIAKKARLEQLEPMEIAQYYTNRYHQYMDALNVLRPSIEPHATGHIIEQQQLVQQILDNGFAYESNGSVYFDIESSLAVRWRISRTRVVNWLVWARRKIRPTLPCGRKLSPNILCAGPHLGATVSLVGTANVLPWDVSTWARCSTSMVVVWTWCSLTMSVR